MDEARRFLRFVIPGIVFAAEVVLLLWIIWGDISFLSNLKNSGAATVIAAALASGGLGVVFSAIHHVFLHPHPKIGVIGVNHTESIARLIKAGILKLEGFESQSLSRDDAWIITTALWHQRLTTNKKIKAADGRTRGLLDLAHSWGTAFVASLAASLAAFVLAGVYSQLATCSLEPIVRFVVAVVIALAAPQLFFSSYLRISQLAQSVVDEVLADALREEKSRAKGQGGESGPILTWPLVHPQIAKGKNPPYWFRLFQRRHEG